MPYSGSVLFAHNSKENLWFTAHKQKSVTANNAWNISVCRSEHLHLCLCRFHRMHSASRHSKQTTQYNAMNNGNRKFSHRKFIIHSTANTKHRTAQLNIDYKFTYCWWAASLSLALAPFAPTVRHIRCVKQILEICNDRLSFSNGSFVLVLHSFCAFVFFVSVFHHIRTTAR